MSGSADSDVLLVGGGLANCLIALRLRALRPELKLTLFEAGPAPGGNHTWSFHGSDLRPAEREWLLPLADHAWQHYEVCFPERRRRIDGAYHTLSSTSLAQAVMALPGVDVHCNARALHVGPEAVQLADGRTLAARLVIDGRGASESDGLVLRYQKFLGQELQLGAPHGLTGPLLMDATVAQRDGYRFVYLLPFAPDRLLVEDTYYSDTPDLAAAALRSNIQSYVFARGWSLRELVREERGVLPIVLDADFDAFWPLADAGLPRSGLRAGLFHHTTGYSLPEAAALADDLAGLADLRSEAVGPWIRGRARRHWQEQRLFRMLNRMLFLAAAPAERYRVLQHFYRLPRPVIERFYAGHTGVSDALRILSGKPPVPVLRALRCLPPSASRTGAA
ncbi:MAG: lycopene beta-cyclase CrtY [Gammaproteobacteria bacterium]|nr:lycopene beta-cyclase CrtY [Gammaproteobacteria bacterium]